MKHSHKPSYTDKVAFTLTELLVVIVIVITRYHPSRRWIQRPY